MKKKTREILITVIIILIFIVGGIFAIIGGMQFSKETRKACDDIGGQYHSSSQPECAIKNQDGTYERYKIKQFGGEYIVVGR